MTGHPSASGQPASATTRQAGQLAPALHRALGLVLLTLAVWLCWSGTLSLYRAELDGWLDPQLRPAMQAGAAQIPAEPAAQLSATQFQARQLQARQLQAALHFVSSLQGAASPEVISAAAPTAASHTASAPLAAVYLEFASSAKPYLTVHLREEGSWQLQRLVLSVPASVDVGAADAATFLADAAAVVLGGAATPEVQVRLLRGPEPAATGSAPQAVGSWFFSLHYQLLGLLGHYGLWLSTAVAALLLWLTLSGLLLGWQQRRRWFFAAGAGKAQRLLRWHLLAGLLVSPWLLWFCGSALFTQLGQWQPGLVEQAGLTRAAYYAQLFPAPVADAAAPAAAMSDLMKLGNPLSLAGLIPAAERALQQARWPVAKLQLELASGRILLTQQAASQIQQPPYQLQQQTFAITSDAQAMPLAQAAYPMAAPWQLRNSLYALHQAAFAGPGLRALLFAGGCLTVIMLLLASESFARRYGASRQGGRRSAVLSLLRMLTSGFVLASLLLLALRAASWLPELSTSWLFAVCWALVSVLLGIGGRFAADKSART